MEVLTPAVMIRLLRIAFIANVLLIVACSSPAAETVTVIVTATPEPTVAPASTPIPTPTPEVDPTSKATSNMTPTPIGNTNFGKVMI